MIKDFGEPPNAEYTRATVERRLEEARTGSAVAETLTVEWRGKPIHVQVIDMPLGDLYYNPNTHRIRAQRALEPDRDERLRENPWSPESQDYLRHLLTLQPSDPSHRDQDFEKLKESLAEHRQLEPGLITHEGVLVNGNTRCAALRELNAGSSIRVGVLPASCTWSDINDVELTLQLRPDRRRDYSYINRLLAIEEQSVFLKRDMSIIAKAFHTDVKSCVRDLWVLAELREVIARSTAGGRALRLMDLERSQEKLAELYRAYVKEKDKNADRAELLKEARLAAIVLDFPKTDVRFIEPDFGSRYLDSVLPEEYKPAAESTEPTAVAIPGLGRSIKATGADVKAARAVTDTLLRAKAVGVAGDAVPPAEKVAADTVIAHYREAFNEAIGTAGRDIRLRKKRLAAPDRINDACKDLEQSITDLVMSRGSSSLDEGAFDDALVRLRDVLTTLSEQTQRSIDLPGEGVTWLIAAVAPERSPV